MKIQRRLTFERLDSFQANHIEETLGKKIWPRFNFELPGLKWHKTEIIFMDDERLDQYERLKQWADTHEQPIRNVKLEKREISEEFKEENI